MVTPVPFVCLDGLRRLCCGRDKLGRYIPRGVVVAIAVLMVAPASAFDLSRTVTETLPNGLRVLVLEDHTFPVVSVQMLYTIGARDEESGKTGLAHFLEHMAFRASESFPGTDVVSRIYAVGGEWHGYTWIDQTTYFATAPRQHLDLLLAIEADRMARLEILPGDVEPERGAVLAELHGYENDPTSVLYDAVVAASFQQHPYRNNTIGWVSDVEGVGHPELLDFYRRHYRPANAVLAIAGDLAPADVLERVRDLFAAFPAGAAAPLPRTIEPPQRGLRRVELAGAGARSRFAIAYRAPAAADPDWPAFLLLREVLAGGEGVNFNQEDFGTRAVEGTRLAGLARDGASTAMAAELTSWLPATALPYVLILAGNAEADIDPARLEEAIEAEIAALREALVPADELGRARQRLATELVYDLETTEDAAHQLAYFEGLGARDVLLELPERLAAVTTADLQRLAQEYLQPWQRTIGWYRAGAPVAEASGPPETVAAGPGPAAPSPAGTTAGTDPAATSSRVSARRDPALVLLPAGLPVLLQHVPASPAVYVRLVLPTDVLTADVATTTDSPLWRHTSVAFRGLKAQLPDLLGAAREALDRMKVETPEPAPSEAPGERLEQTLREQLDIASPSPGPRSPVLLVVAGDLEGLPVEESLAGHFGGLLPGILPEAPAPAVAERERTVSLAGRGLAQAQLGYAVPAPPPGHPDHLAWRLLLYVLTHGYEGRLGEEAIGRRGLLYYVDSRYHTDGRSGWIALTMGVDPDKLEPLRQLFAETLAGLATSPPSEEELAEARAHLLGRRLSAAQSNEEISAFLAREWIGRGEVVSQERFSAELERVRREDVLRIVPEFVAGATAVVTVD